LIPRPCEPIYPDQYLHVNTIFEVAHRHHLLTAWSDKRPVQLILSAPPGEVVDDYFTPEINSSANQTAPTDPSQHGVVYTGKKGKIAEHGGDHLENRNVPILIVWPGAPRGTAVTAPVETTEIAPTILELLGLDPNELQAVRIEQTSPLF
jgi:hypothetical protein